MIQDQIKGNFSNGEWLSKGSGASIEILDKYNGNTLAALPLASKSQMDSAIDSAAKAFEVSRNWSAGKRAEKMELLYAAIKNNSTAFVNLIVAEAGKPITYAEAELKRSLSTLKIAIEEAKRLGGEVVPMDFNNGEGRTAFTKRFPIGVVVAITPFNFPLNLLIHKVAAALAVGCTVVVKPPPQAPLTALFLAKLISEAGFPNGSVNVLACDVPIAEYLVKDERLALLSFTGSDKVGWHLKSICGKKKVVLELGGNAAVLIDKDVDVMAVADKVAKGAYLYAGQICISTQRIFVHQLLYEDFKNALIKAIGKLKTGNPLENDSWAGPLIDKKAFERTKAWVNEAKAAGAELLIGGSVIDEEKNLFEPTLFTNTNAEMKIYAEEAFAPIAILEKVKDFTAGIQAVNNARYGLQAGVFTNSLKHFKMASEQIVSGGIIFNDIPGFRIDHMPYGGLKDSGLGKEGLKYSMEEMTEMRLIVY